MNRTARLMTVCLLALGATTIGSAREVVEFRTGLYLEVLSHEVVDDTARLYFSTNSYLAVPLDRLDRIERDGREVFQAAATDTQGAEEPSPVVESTDPPVGTTRTTGKPTVSTRAAVRPTPAVKPRR